MKINVILLLLLILTCVGCEDTHDTAVETQPGVHVVLFPQSTRGVNADNLLEEYKITNLSLFLTEAGSNTVANKFVYQSFSVVNDTAALATLPLDPATVGKKDVYVVTNNANSSALNAVQTVDDIKALKTRQATTAQGLTTTDGLPMYGQSLGANLGSTSSSNPALVDLYRTCAKLRVKVHFTDANHVGTNNAFKIENAAPYTYYVKNDNLTFNTSDLVAYPRMNLNQVDAQNFQGITYVYESSITPIMHIYTTINGAEQQFTITKNFPLPVRNNLYDLEISIYPDTRSGTRAGLSYSLFIHSQTSHTHS